MANPIKERLGRISWTSDKTFDLDGLSYLVDVGIYQHKTRPDCVVILKPDGYFPAYADTIRGAPTRNVLELGLWQGGSAFAFASLLDPVRFVGIDICEPIEGFDRLRAEHPLGRRIGVHYRTSQDDEARLEAILADEFEGPLDLVIDDASHDFHLTRRSFEILFPHVRPGGFYVIEDWGWAHARGFALWTDKPAMSNLIYQLLMVNAGRPDLISSIHVFRGLAFVRKGSDAPVGGQLRLDDLCWMQDREYRLL